MRQDRKETDIRFVVLKAFVLLRHMLQTQDISIISEVALVVVLFFEVCFYQKYSTFLQTIFLLNEKKNRKTKKRKEEKQKNLTANILS